MAISVASLAVGSYIVNILEVVNYRAWLILWNGLILIGIVQLLATVAIAYQAIQVWLLSQHPMM